MISYYTDSFAFAKGERPSWLEYLIRFQFILTFHVWIKNSIKFLPHWNTFSVLSAISFNLSKFQRLKCAVFFFLEIREKLLRHNTSLPLEPGVQKKTPSTHSLYIIDDASPWHHQSTTSNKCVSSPKSKAKKKHARKKSVIDKTLYQHAPHA